MHGVGTGRTTAVDNVSASFSAGEFSAIYGPSGSGKTSFLVALGLLRSPDAGFVEISGINTSGFNETEKTAFRLKHLGFVFQSHRLMESLNAIENVQLALGLQGVGQEAQVRRAKDCLEKLNMEHKASLFPAQLSGGERQRVAIARAVVNRPEVVLADEPTASLDSTNAKAVGELLSQISREGTTVIAVTHDEELIHFADRAIRMRDGRITNGH